MVFNNLHGWRFTHSRTEICNTTKVAMASCERRMYSMYVLVSTKNSLCFVFVINVTHVYHICMYGKKEILANSDLCISSHKFV